MKEIDIASFAENLLEEEVSKGKPVQFAAAQAPDAPDVSDVEVPNNFASQVLSEGHWAKAHVDVGTVIVEESTPAPAPKKKAPVSTPKLVNEESVYKQHLLVEYKKKVDDLKELVSLMESLGIVGTGSATGATFTTSLGTGPMGKNPQKKKKKTLRKNAPRRSSY
jgi:hypothetical protein